MHIAQINSHGGINGVATSCAVLYEALAALGHRLTVVHRPGAWIAGQNASGVLRFLPWDMGVRWPHVSEARAVYRLLVAQGVEVIHTHGSAAHIYGALFRMFGPIPVVATAHCRRVQPHWWLNSAVIAPSAQTARFHRRYNLVPRHRMHVVPHMFAARGIAPAEPERRQAARDALGLPPGFVFGVVGDIMPRKNQSLAACVLGELVARGIDARCVLIGKPDRRETAKIERIVREGATRDRLHMAGFRRDARELLTGLDAVLCTSRIEEGPIALLEAMAAGLPVFSTDVGMAGEMIRAGENGLVFDPSDRAPLVDALADLAQSAPLAAAMGARSRRRLEERFAPETVVRQVEAVYRKVSREGLERVMGIEPTS